MFRNPVRTPPRWWAPRLNRFWIWFWRPFRRRRQLREQQLHGIELRGVGHLERVLGGDRGVLITPNHPGSADPYILYHLADRVKSPFYFMTAWQLFWHIHPLGRLALQHHGAFSVDREGTDLRAYKQAVEVLSSSPYPLVIFPEGEVYHISDRLTPFREGPATIALSAAKRAKRPVVVVPAAMKYHYTEDPTPELLRLMNALEEEVFWRPRPDLPLGERIYRLAEGLLALKELEYFGHTASGDLPERISALTDFVLSGLEKVHGGAPNDSTTPERIKTLRQRILKQMERLPEDDAGRKPYQDALDDLFLVVQLFSYPGDYVAEEPSIERIAETLDKFEEDVIGDGLRSAAIRAARRATLALGEPIPVEPSQDRRGASAALTALLEERVQSLLDGITAPPGRDFDRVDGRQA